MTPMFSIFTLAIIFDCLFLTIYQRFHLFVGFSFDKLAPPLDICFKRCFKSLSSPLQCIKQSQKCKKCSAFPILHFGRHVNGWGGYSPLAPPPLVRFGWQFISPPPLNKRFKLCFKAFFSLIQCKRQS